MTELVPGDDVPQEGDALLAYLVDLTERGRRVAAVQINATLTMTYWHVGRAIAMNTLRDGRADYGQQILATLSPELAERFGTGFHQSNLARMVRFGAAIPRLRRSPHIGRAVELVARRRSVGDQV